MKEDRVGKVGDIMTFNDKDYKSKLTYIEKYYSDDTLFFAAYLNNYNGFHIYIRIDYIEKYKCYKLRWFDLDFVKTSKISVFESSEYVEEEAILESAATEVKDVVKLNVVESPVEENSDDDFQLPDIEDEEIPDFLKGEEVEKF